MQLAIQRIYYTEKKGICQYFFAKKKKFFSKANREESSCSLLD